MRHTLKVIFAILWFIWLVWIWNAWYDFTIQSITLSNWEWAWAKWTVPKIDVEVWNVGTDIAKNIAVVPEWFVRCYLVLPWNQKASIWWSSALQTFITNAGTTNILTLTLSNLVTATARTDDIECVVWWTTMSITNGVIDYTTYFQWSEDSQSNNSFTLPFTVTVWWRYDSSLDESVASIRNHLDAAVPNSPKWWWVTVQTFIQRLISTILVPIVVIAGIILGILWAYSALTSSDPAKMKKWASMLIFGVVWIIVILSANYIWNAIFDIFGSWNMTDLNWVNIAQSLYEKIAYPFIKMAIYLSLGVLFVVLAWKSISIVTSGDIKKAGNIIIWTAISMLVIIWAKQIVEAVYWKQQDVLNSTATNLWEIWTGLLANKNIPILYEVINWVLGLTATIILVIILVQTFQILINPSKAENWNKLWKSILYIFIGLVVIWAWYLLTNLLIIN